MEDEDGSRSVMVSMVGAGWKETSYKRQTWKSVWEGWKGIGLDATKILVEVRFSPRLRSSGTVVPAGTVPRVGEPSSSLSSLPPRKNEINAALWHRTKGKGLSVNLTTLRFRLQNSFRRMENERNDTKGPPTVRQDPVLGMRLIVTYFTSAQIASLGIVVRWIVMDPLD